MRYLAGMEPRYTEIELPHIERTDLALYAALKLVPMLILYREVIAQMERLAIVVINDKVLSEVEALLKSRGVEPKSRHEINQTRLDDIERGDYPECFDGFDTRTNRYWTGDWGKALL